MRVVAIYEVALLEEALTSADRGADFVLTRKVRSLSESRLSQAAGSTYSKLESTLGERHRS